MDFVFPPGTPWELDDIRAQVIDGQPPAGFDCGRDAQNAFLYSRAWRDAKAGVTVTHLLFIKGLLASCVAHDGQHRAGARRRSRRGSPGA